MNKAITAMKFAGLTLKDFRNKTRQERFFLWMMVVATVEIVNSRHGC